MKTESWFAQCLRKAKSRTLEKANKIINKQISLGVATYLRAYYCDCCFSYHITHLPERKIQ